MTYVKVGRILPCDSVARAPWAVEKTLTRGTGKGSQVNRRRPQGDTLREMTQGLARECEAMAKEAPATPTAGTNPAVARINPNAVRAAGLMLKHGLAKFSTHASYPGVAAGANADNGETYTCAACGGMGCRERYLVGFANDDTVVTVSAGCLRYFGLATAGTKGSKPSAILA